MAGHDSENSMPDGPVDNIAALAEATAAQPDREKETVSERLVRLGEQEELFHDDNRETFVSALVKGHRETWALRSRSSREYLARRYYEDTRKVPGGQALQDALNVLHGRALHDGPEKRTHVRLARLGDAIFVDLGDEQRRVIELRAGMWSYVADPPVRFRRPRGMLALPVPEPGGALDEIKPFVNVVKPSAWHLVLAWLIALFFPGPYAWLVFQGRQGAAKTASSRFLRQTVDLNRSPVRAPPKKVRDLVIAAANSIIMALDNVSYLDEEQSDALCRLSTGSGLSTRELYSDTDEVVVEVQRAGILNGITDIIARGDLLDRAILIELPPLPKGCRRTEEQMLVAFHEAWPRILGAILDTVAAVHQELPRVHIEDPPRMADFAHVGVALEHVLGWPAGTFLSAYGEAIEAAIDVALDASVIAPFVTRVGAGEVFEGTATELLELLNNMLDDRLPRGAYGHVPSTPRKPRPEGWPKSPKALSSQLRRLDTSLLAKGITITFGKTHGDNSRRIITIRRVEASAPPVDPTPAPCSEPDAADAGRDPGPSTTGPIRQQPLAR